MSQLLASTQKEIELLSAEIDTQTKLFAEKPRRKQLSASTREYAYANYLDAWRRKVERIGNINYPEEAKRKKLHGSLILTVSIKADGTIDKIRVARSSGIKILDDAAKRIVRLASPYSAFPAEIRKKYDILDITRTWQFRNTNKLYAQ
jgi:protein TonB